jgi:hypothetical protein
MKARKNIHLEGRIPILRTRSFRFFRFNLGQQLIPCLLLSGSIGCSSSPRADNSMLGIFERRILPLPLVIGPAFRSQVGVHRTDIGPKTLIYQLLRVDGFSAIVIM